MRNFDRPTPDLVRDYLRRWDESDDAQFEAGLDDLFTRHRENTELSHISVKVAALNGLYATWIGDVWGVARRILALKIDGDLNSGTRNDALVKRVMRYASVNDTTGKESVRNNRSFASKYCCFHRPDLYPIYDSIVCVVLSAMKRQYRFTKTPASKWDDYTTWCQVLDDFRTFFELAEFSPRDLDKYLWMTGKGK